MAVAIRRPHTEEISPMKDSPKRVRNAQALRDERAYEKAKASTEPVPDDVLYRMRRKALPSEPCVDCGSRMACAKCDKVELSELLLEDYQHPPEMFAKSVQCDVLAELEEPVGDQGPTEAEILAKELSESREQESLLRGRIRKVKADAEDVRLKQEAEIAERTRERDEFEAESIKQRERAELAEDALAKLHILKDEMERSYEEQLAQKREEIRALHALRGGQHEAMNLWLKSEAMKGLQEQLLREWYWTSREGRLIREWEAKLAAKEREMREMEAKYEKLLEEARERYVALEVSSAKKQQELEGEIAEREEVIAKTVQELEETQHVLCETRAEFKEAVCRLEGEVKQCMAETEAVRVRLRSTEQAKIAAERGMEEAKAEKERLAAKEQEMAAALQKQREAAASRQGNGRSRHSSKDHSCCETGENWLPNIVDEEKLMTEAKLKEQETLIADLETSLVEAEEKITVAEQKYTVAATVLQQCQDKAMYLRKRLENEVKHHLDSQARYWQLTKQRTDLEVRLEAQKRCLGLRKVKNSKIDMHTREIQNEMLEKRIAALNGRVSKVKGLANACSSKELRWALKRAAGKSDVVAHREAFFKALIKS